MRRILSACALLLSLNAQAMDDNTHLSTTQYTTGAAFTRMMPATGAIMEFDVTPKPGNKTWTSIKTCLGMWPWNRSVLKTELINVDTGETYFWNKNSFQNECTKEVFDIPIHTFHKLKLKFTCFASNVHKGKTDYCKGFVILYSSIQEVIQ